MRRERVLNNDIVHQVQERFSHDEFCHDRIWVSGKRNKDIENSFAWWMLITILACGTVGQEQRLHFCLELHTVEGQLLRF
jgi:hypothetical protein